MTFLQTRWKKHHVPCALRFRIHFSESLKMDLLITGRFHQKSLVLCFGVKPLWLRVRIALTTWIFVHKTGPIYSDGIGWYWMVLNVDSKLKLLLPWSVKPYNMILDRFSRLIRKISVLKGKLFDEVNCTSFTHWEYRLTLTCKRVEQELFDWNLWFEFTMEEVGFWPVDDFTDCSFRGVLTLYMQQSVDISR